MVAFQQLLSPLSVLLLVSSALALGQGGHRRLGARATTKDEPRRIHHLVQDGSDLVVLDSAHSGKPPDPLLCPTVQSEPAGGRVTG